MPIALGIHHITMKYNAPPVDSHLSGDDWPGMQGAAYGRCYVEIIGEPRCGIGQGGLDRKEAGQWASIAAAGGNSPGNDDLVAHVLVNLSEPIGYGVCDQGEQTVEQAMHGKRSDLLGNLRRSNEIHKKEKALLYARPVVTTEHEIAQRTAAHQAADLQQKNDDKNNDNRVIFYGQPRRRAP